MIIHRPKTEIIGDKVRISAYIEIEKKTQYSDTLWFEFDKKYKDYLSETSNGFVANMMLFAMLLKEDIKVKGKISPQLEYGLREIQGFYNFWEPEQFDYQFQKKFHKVKIKHEGYIVEKNKEKGVMSTFSGGVDSFYTLWDHLPKNESNPLHQISHCLYLDGLNYPLQDNITDYYNIHNEKYGKLAEKNNLELVSVKSNFEDFYIKRSKTYATAHYGMTLTSIALLLSPLIHRFYVASAFTYSTVVLEGSGPIADPLLSTETLEVIHHECSVSRVDKTKEIAKWSDTYDKLMVCIHEDRELNCCECTKCVRTMITLELAGTLSKYTTFPEKLTSKKIKNWNEERFSFRSDVFDYAKEVNNKRLLKDIEIAVDRANKILYRDNIFTYTRKKLWAAMWAPSAFLKKNSKSYRNFVKRIKKEVLNNENDYT